MANPSINCWWQSLITGYSLTNPSNSHSLDSIMTWQLLYCMMTDKLKSRQQWQNQYFERYSPLKIWKLLMQRRVQWLKVYKCKLPNFLKKDLLFLCLKRINELTNDIHVCCFVTFMGTNFLCQTVSFGTCWGAVFSCDQMYCLGSVRLSLFCKWWSL